MKISLVQSKSIGFKDNNDLKKNNSLTARYKKHVIILKPLNIQLQKEIIVCQQKICSKHTIFLGFFERIPTNDIGSYTQQLSLTCTIQEVTILAEIVT